MAKYSLKSVVLSILFSFGQNIIFFNKGAQKDDLVRQCIQAVYIISPKHIIYPNWVYSVEKYK